MKRTEIHLLVFGSASLVVLALLGACSMIKPEPPSIVAGREYFHHRAIGSPYSTGIPYALWLATMERYPDDLGRNWDEFREKFGLLKEDDDPSGLPVGFVLEGDRLSGTTFLMTTCALCHTAKIGDQRIEGLGARDLRLNALNNTVMRLAARHDFMPNTLVGAAEEAARRGHIPWGWRARLVTKEAVKQLQQRASRHVEMDAGPGRNAPLEFTKAVLQVPIEPPFGYVRFHPVWTYSKRQSFGLDGVMTGNLALAAALVEFNKGMSPYDIVRHQARFDSIYEYLTTVRPPPYPGQVAPILADRGHMHFLQQCAGCHGTYGPGTSIQYQERTVPLSEIGTDPDRLQVITPELVAAFNRTPLGKRAPMKPTDGYIARPLDGIWCRGPYLHNGAVPTLNDLLRPARERPVKFYVGGHTGYDLDRLGLSYEEELLPDGRRTARLASPLQFEFDTRAPGNSNLGHEFGTDLSAEDRKALIEYLKQL